MKKFIIYCLWSILLITGQLSAQSYAVKTVFEDLRTTAGVQAHFFKAKTITDGSGNIYVVGATLNNAGNYDLLICKYNSAGTLLWSDQFDGVGNGLDAGTDVIVDAGNVYVTGTTYKDATDSNNVITRKYNSSGTLQWSQTFNGSGSANDAGASLILNNGYVYVAGATWAGPNRYDYLVLSYKDNSTGDYQWDAQYDHAGYDDAALKIFMSRSILMITGGSMSSPTDVDYDIVYYSTAGSFLGNTRTTGSTNGFDWITDAVTNPATGDIYLTGSIDNSGGGTGLDYYTVWIDSTLVIQGTETYDGGSSTDDRARSIAIDGSGNVIVTGWTGSTSAGTDYTTISYPIHLGSPNWTATYNDTANGNDTAVDVVIDPNDNVYVTGSTFNGETYDYHTIKYDNSGNEIWSIDMNSFQNADDVATAMAYDSAGGIVVTGQSQIPGAITYTTVRYIEKDIIIPPDPTDLSNIYTYQQNRGQLWNTDSLPEDRIKFYCGKSSPKVFLSDTSVSYVFSHIDTSNSIINDTLHRVDMTFPSTNGSPQRIRAMEMRKDYYNYYSGNVGYPLPRVPVYERLVNTNVFSKIDIMFFSNALGMKYDFIVWPGGNPSDIKMKFAGMDSLKIINDTLRIYTKLGVLNQVQAKAFEIDNSGNRVNLAWKPSYSYNSVTKIVTFTSIGSYNNARTLVFECDWGNPSSIASSAANLIWSTYLGGSDYDALGRATIDPSNRKYVAGTTYSINFPVVPNWVVQPSNAGLAGSSDAVVAAFFYDDQPMWTTYYGGSGDDFGAETVVKEFGAHAGVYLVGSTKSTNFPITGNGTSFAGGAYDAFVLKLNLGGTAVNWSTCYGGNTGYETARYILLDNSDNIRIAGWDPDSNTPLTTETGASNFNQGNSFLVKYDPNNYNVLWATRYGGTTTNCLIQGFAVVGLSDVTVISGSTTGNGLPSATNSNSGNSDAFVAKFNSSDQLQWSTYYGGTGNDFNSGIALNSGGDIFITGTTASTSGLPTPNPGGAYNDASFNGGTGYGDSYLAGFTSAGTNFWGTYLGGSADDVGFDIAIDFYDDVFVTGRTKSSNFPVQNPVGTYNQALQGIQNAYLWEFDATLAPVWGTYFGGDNSDEGDYLTIFNNYQYNYVYLTGVSLSTNTTSSAPFPIVDPGSSPPAYVQQKLNGNDAQTNNIADGFIAQFDLNPVTPGGVKNIDIDNTFIVFPNPSSGEFNIQLSSKDRQDVSVEVFNSIGQILYKSCQKDVFGIYKKRVNLENIESGIYIVKVQIGSRILGKKIVFTK
jgi:hypothetical protein